jgi:AcrR family transcriptional regulator
MAKAARKPRGDTSTGPGPTPARATRITRTRPVLCGALLSLLEDRPFEQLTVREITAKADIGYATFFRHYPDKESLLNDLAAFQISELLSMALPILYAANTRASARALCIYVWEHRKLWSTLLTGGAAGTLRDEFIPGDLLVVFSVTGTVEILAWWLKQAAPPSIDQMAEVLDCLVVAPSMRRSGSRRPLKPPK